MNYDGFGDNTVISETIHDIVNYCEYLLNFTTSTYFINTLPSFTSSLMTTGQIHWDIFLQVVYRMLDYLAVL